VATDEKYGRLKNLMETGKEKGFVLYDEVNELIAEEFPSGREFEDLLTDLDSAGVEILEEPKLEFEKSKEEPDDFGDLELAQETGDKTNDPVRMYLREMGTVPLLTREGEIELAKRNERGQWAVRKALSNSARICSAELPPCAMFWCSPNSSLPMRTSPGN
jgi:RNA polymerase primary sigma factor